MKNDKNYSASGGMAHLAALLLLVCTFNAQATAPRITAQLFGEESRADIVAYQVAPSDAAAQSENALTFQIVTEAFKVAGKSPIVDVLPSKQLASYALFNNDAVGLIGTPHDLAEKDKKQYSMVAFYLRESGDQPVVLIFSRAHGAVLHKAFVDGLKSILKSGKYQELIEKQRGKLPADYVSRMKRLNPGWK